MRYKFLMHSKKVDPEYFGLRSAILSAICCLLSIVLFQALHQATLVGWAAFAALAYSQIDMLEVPSRRIPHLIICTVIFSALAWIGILLGRTPTWFLLSVPFVIFVCGCTISFGNRYFNPGAWAAFLYIAFGSSLGDRFFAGHIALTFLGIGLMCIAVSLLLFPESPGKRLRDSCVRILEDGLAGDSDVAPLLISQNKLLQIYLTRHVANAQHATYWQFHKGLYQLFLLRQQLESIQVQAQRHASFAETMLSNSPQQTQDLIEALLTLLKKGTGHFPRTDELIQQHRESIKNIQIVECQQPDPDLTAILDYSNYLRHVIQIWELLNSLAAPAEVIAERAES